MRSDLGATELLDVQRRFLAAISEPIFGESRAKSELPPRDGGISDAFVATARALVRPSKTMAPEERLELYHRQYWYRLLDSMAEDFPELRRFLGEEPFWRAVEDYLERTPPRSFTLRHLGANFPEFIGGMELGAEGAHARDLARIEWALCVAFEAAEHAPITAEALGSKPLALQPHLQLLELSSAADTTWRRGAKGRRPTRAGRRFVAVFRDGEALKVERLPRGAFVLLSGLAARPRLVELMEHLAATRGLFAARDVARTADWFRTWMTRGWLRERGPDDEIS